MSSVYVFLEISSIYVPHPCVYMQLVTHFWSPLGRLVHMCMPECGVCIVLSTSVRICFTFMLYKCKQNNF